MESVPHLALLYLSCQINLVISKRYVFLAEITGFDILILEELRLGHASTEVVSPWHLAVKIDSHSKILVLYISLVFLNIYVSPGLVHDYINSDC